MQVTNIGGHLVKGQRFYCFFMFATDKDVIVHAIIFEGIVGDAEEIRESGMAMDEMGGVLERKF